MFLLDLLFPKNCLECGKSAGYICARCINKVKYSETICPGCRKFNFYGKAHNQCLSTHSLNGLVSLWEYKGIIKKSINELKYHFASEVAKDIANVSLIEIKKFKLPQKAAFVPIPLHKERENWRGFNQAELLAKLLSKELEFNFIPDLLIKQKSSKPQVRAQPKNRLRNISGKIAVNTTVLDQIDKKTPLFIVDDVWTTGATMKEACKVLKEAGFKTVWGITVARA